MARVATKPAKRGRKPKNQTTTSISVNETTAPKKRGRKPKKKLVGVGIADKQLAKMLKSHEAEEMQFKAPDGRKITISYELITPEIADEMLKLNTGNRGVDNRLVKSLSRKMKKELFKFNGDTVRFSEPVEQNGKKEEILLDGQHRLNSIIHSGKPQFCLVIRGLDRNAFATMDDGRKRSASDILSIAEIDNPRKKAGIAKTVILFANGYYRSTKGGGDRSASPGNIEVLDFVRENETKITEAIDVAQDVRRTFPYLNSKILSSMYYIFAGLDKQDAKEFYEELKRGKKSTEQAIRMFCTEMVKDAKREHKLPYNTVLAYFIKTWNAFREGKKLTKLSYDKKTEEFPKPL